MFITVKYPAISINDKFRKAYLKFNNNLYLDNFIPNVLNTFFYFKIWIFSFINSDFW